jgi:hypothetical protein
MSLTVFGITIQFRNKGLKIIEEKELYLYIDISKWLDFRVFSDKDVSYMAGTADPLSIGQ